LKIANPYGDLIEVPETCEIACRTAGNKKYLFVLNYTKGSVRLTLKKEMQDMYTGTKVFGTVELAAYGTAVYKIE
jgi:beta-galactosidase